MTRWIVMMIAMADWIAKTKEYKSANGKKVGVRHIKDGKGSSLFAMEDIDKDDNVIEYVGKNDYTRRENKHMMKINGMNLRINGDKNGGPAQYMNYSCDTNCKLVQRDVYGSPGMCFFPKKNKKSGMEFTFNYN
jgi:SET domain-containing protein